MQGYYSRRTTLHLQKYPSKNTSTALLITENRPHVQSHSESAQGEKLRYKLHKSTSFEIDQAHYLHKIFQRIEYSNDLRPLGHTGYRGKQSAHQDENHNEEKHDEHRLLYRIGIIRDNQPEPRNNQYIYMVANKNIVNKLPAGFIPYTKAAKIIHNPNTINPMTQ